LIKAHYHVLISTLTAHTNSRASIVIFLHQRERFWKCRIKKAAAWLSGITQCKTFIRPSNCKTHVLDTL